MLKHLYANTVNKRVNHIVQRIINLKLKLKLQLFLLNVFNHKQILLIASKSLFSLAHFAYEIQKTRALLRYLFVFEETPASE